jgi:hypothetical protein
MIYRPLNTNTSNPLRQRGVTLIVAVILLLLLSVIVLLATNVGLQEQRASGNDFRSKMAHYAAEAGLNFGGEFFKQNVGQLRDPARWQTCTDNSFPCGVFPAGGVRQFYTGNLTLPAPMAGGTLDLGGSGFNANVIVGAVICRIPDGAAPGTPCATDLSGGGSSVLSIVSRAQVAGEASSATLVQSITSFSKLNSVTGVPPITSSGSMDVTGSLDVVGNPNAAGPGVPVSVWTRKDVDANGTPQTCYLDEFVRFGAKNNAPATFCGVADGCSTVRTDILLCDNCGCPADENSLSFSKPGNSCGEGIDILDIDVGPACGPNADVRPEDFPCDLFEFVFGVQVRTDEDGDFFCETLIKVDHDNDAATPDVGADELWLRENANVIIVANPDTNRDARERGCAFLTSTARGLVWDRVGCTVGGQVGGPENPVVLVVDGDAQYNAGFRLFGLLFVRALDDVLDPDEGGDATLRFAGRGAIYGAAVVQGEIEKANGTAAFIYNEAVLSALVNSPELQAFGTLPGAWTDRFSY